MALTDEEEVVIKKEVAALKLENAAKRTENKELKDQIAEVTGEKKKVEEQVTTLTQQLTSTKEEVTKVKAESDTKIAELTTAQKEQQKMAKLQVLALKEGMVDPDGLKLADTSKITVDDKGELVGTEDLFKGLKETKPYLFGVTGNTTQPKTPKKQGEHEEKDVRTMKPEDYEAEKLKMING